MEPIRGGQLMDDQIAYGFMICYLPLPTKEPLAEFDALRTARFPHLEKVERISSPVTRRTVAARMITDGAFTAPPMESLQYFGRGISQQQAEAVQLSKSFLAIDFAYPRQHVWNGMRSALELASSLARSTGGLLWDDETREMFTPDEWDKQRIADWTEEFPNISQHTTIHAYSTGEYVRAITLGMEKFGLPDIVIDDFSWSLNRPMGNLMVCFCQAIAEGGKIGRGGEFDLDLKSIQNRTVRKSQIQSLKPNATSVALLSLKKGVWEAGDPQNRLIEIAFDRHSGPDVHVKQVKMVSTLFGWDDALKGVKHDELLLEASRRAQYKLPAGHGVSDWTRPRRVYSRQSTIQDSRWKRRMDVGRSHILGRRQDRGPLAERTFQYPGSSRRAKRRSLRGTCLRLPSDSCGRERGRERNGQDHREERNGQEEPKR